MSHPLTADEKLAAFKRATRALPKWHAEAIKRGMTNDQLATALARVLGTGGSTGPGQLTIWHEGNGLRIWAGREWTFRGDRPIFAGAATVAMARHVYGIADPTNPQLPLF